MSKILEFERFARRHDFSRIVRFHNESRSYLRDNIGRADALDPTLGTLWKARWRDFDGLLRTNTFLMLYAYAEEWLNILSKKRHPMISIKDGGSISRYKTVLRDGFGLDVSSNLWCLLTDCEKIRDCLLHANGRVDLMQNESEIRSTAKRRGLNIKLNRLQISSKFLASFAEQTEAFIQALN